MYNEERKMRFLTETRSSTDYGRSIFKRTSEYEEKAGADLCELPLSTLQTLANQNFGARTRAVYSAIAFLRSYVMWCKENGYNVVDDIYKVQTQMDEKVKRLMVASPKHLQSILDKAFHPLESETVDCVYRCYLWMAFAGMEEADALNVKVNEIDFSSMLIEHGGKSYEIYREAMQAFRMACDATEFVYEHPNYKQRRSRCPGDYLMRGIRSDKIKATTIKSVVKKAFKSNGIELTYSNIRLSGMFYRAYETERMGDEVNFDGMIAEHIIKMDSTFHKNYTRSKVANLIKRDLFDDYACWKAAFT